jgi:hypothetical protein
MTLTITLNDIRIITWTVDVDRRTVTVHYQRLTDTGDPLDDGMAVFWDTLPDPGTDPQGNPVPLPSNWYQLPTQYAQILTDLTLDVRQALMHLVNP